MTVVIQLKKECSRCGASKFLDEYYLRRDRKGGKARLSHCIVCEKKRNRQNYLERKHKK